ncbi:transporter substrate-binding domain-containing protein [Thauera linaloolentis]|uniref:Extracellular solute-binding protein n=1 Tax=Thauera linaloolentis (strain DSM 12138 / JCM 21573 / CCUG 41526 / CIP 105981 / IAM 15112 / NBRC 102519 / 47Lol) TaxID=1123367 RepID=N6XS18_THAL4|nr:transporter substrate-binding domain-containing protein [Thauera linaloolentis]ENO84511.1 extracellular solute-binding protein [Thauera linaloolentis 47Lol = DSM 12138]MCM8565247.1 transporter substrate-binding domain-containing protein [Thauera linaloolentis]
MLFHFHFDEDDPSPLPPAGGRRAERVDAARRRSRWQRAALAIAMLAAVAGGLAGGYFGVAGRAAASTGHAEAAVLSAGASLRVGLVGSARPTSDTRDYTADGLQVGFAEEIARRLGVDAELVPLSSAQAQTAISGGEVDVLLAKGLPPSLPQAGVTVLDTGFASGLNVLMRSDSAIRRWSQFEGRTLCVTGANAAAHALARALGAQAHAFEAPAQALIAMRTGLCDGSVHDAALLDALGGKAEWKKFSATLGAREPLPLQLALKPGSPALEAALRAALKALDRPAGWRQRIDKWAANVAFEVFFDQIGPDCH